MESAKADFARLWQRQVKWEVARYRIFVHTQTKLTATTEETRTLEDYLAELLRLRVEIDAEQEAIEQLKTDNRELKAEICAMLTLLKATVLT